MGISFYVLLRKLNLISLLDSKLTNDVVLSILNALLRGVTFTEQTAYILKRHMYCKQCVQIA